MTDTRKDVHQAAAQAALDVPGVAGLEPSLADRLALAAARVQHAVTAAAITSQPEPAGIRARLTQEGSWHVEVRCVLRADRSVVATARLVREEVRTAVTACLVQHEEAGPVTVLVSVTRTV
ncbi:hypothetical protein [Streptomyces sp. NPDC059874]|uniref:hypothetical protein n=1 Tax=Streptomyces sp. NPDC059874 TaxID=3346983 RepID=UPI00364F07AF